MRPRWRFVKILVYLLPVAFLGVFFVYPILTLFDISLRPDGALDLSAFAHLTSSDYYRETLLFTIYQALISTGATLLLALPCAFVFARYRFRGRSLLLSLATLPFVLPTVVVALAFSAVLGERGLVNDMLRLLFSLNEAPIQLERTLAIIIIAHVFYNFSVALRIMTGYWSSLGFHAEEAARCLGAGELAIWRDIRLPLIRPALLSAGVLVFIFCFTSFGVVLILGGIRFATLEVQIYYQAVSIFNLPLAAALSLVQIASMLLMLLVYTASQRRLQIPHGGRSEHSARPHSPRARMVVIITVGLMAILLFSPLAALLWRSLFAAGNLDATGFTSLAEKTRASLLSTTPLEAVFNSLRFALIATAAAVILGTAAAFLIEQRGVWSRLVDPLFMLPLATSAVTLGFGFIVALDEPPLDLRRSWIIIPVSHALVALPFVIRSVLPSLRAIPPSLGEAARVLGARETAKLRTIDLPLVGRGLVVGATFAFTVSMGEFGASLFVAQRESVTIPVVIYRLLGHPGLQSYRQALAMSVILMLVCAGGFLIIERLRGAGVGEF